MNKDQPRMLLVDSHPGARGQLAEFFRERGFSVETVADGQSARRCLAPWGRPADIILLDPQLPDMDGLELIKGPGRHRETPLIMISAQDDPQSRIRSLSSGADDFLRRPCNRQELLARVRAVMRRYRRSRPH